MKIGEKLFVVTSADADILSITYSHDAGACRTLNEALNLQQARGGGYVVVEVHVVALLDETG